METITFYSYKGGTGRTLALANVAMYLARFDQSVCLIDFDLEAPGLCYKFPKLLKTEDVKRGLVDYIDTFLRRKTSAKKIADFFLPIIPPRNSHGGMWIMPAGNVLSATYWKNLAAINWHSLFYEENSEGVPFFLELKEKIRREFKPDFLLIDSRTGVTEMSGLCTSILPDKVVFLIVNNPENIEGARQIFRSINQLKPLGGKKPIDVYFALTRIPLSRNEKEERLEDDIVLHIKDFMNVTLNGNGIRAKVEDICVLHSDRDLELSESLRIQREGTAEETPLSRDYLRLFAKVIPERVVTGKLENVLSKITSKIWVDPDLTQKELEGLVASYPHPSSLETLLDFYFIRNEGKEKILTTFHRLWAISKSFNLRFYSKYISYFMKDKNVAEYQAPKYDLEIIEKYLLTNPESKMNIEIKLANTYAKYDRPDKALEHYSRIVQQVPEKQPILSDMLEICITKEWYDKALDIFKMYSDIIDKDMPLRTKKLALMVRTSHIDEVKKLLNESTEKYIEAEDLSLYFSVMEALGRINEVDNKMDSKLAQALRSGSAGDLMQVGRLFYRLGRDSEFRAKSEGRRPWSDEVIHELDMRYGRRRYGAR